MTTSFPPAVRAASTIVCSARTRSSAPRPLPCTRSLNASLASKIAGIAREIPQCEIFGDEQGGPLVVLGWGSTFGSIREAIKQLREKGKRVSHVHLRYLNPLPPDLEETLKRFKQVMIAEMNMGQLLKMVRADYLIDAFGFNKIQGRPFKVSEIVNRINRALEG